MTASPDRPSPSIRLAIASASPARYSETFVALQMDRLACAMRIHGPIRALETVPGGTINPFGTCSGWLASFRKAMGLKSVAPTLIGLQARLENAGINRLLINFGNYAATLAPLAVRMDLPYVVHFHGHDAHKHSILHENAEAYRMIGRTAGAVVAVSEGMLENLQAAGIPRAKLHLARCGVDPARFQPRAAPPAEPFFFAIGRFVDKKAPYLTLLAFARVLRADARARLVIAGDGELVETCRNLAQCLSLADSVSFPGVIAPSQVSDYMQRATAFVQHSIEPLAGPSAGDREGTPVAVIEAMMSGVPVVATRHAGIGEILVDRITGLLVEERDVDGMAKGMLELIANRELAVAISEAARKVALEHHTADAYLAKLSHIIAQARPPSAAMVSST